MKFAEDMTSKQKVEALQRYILVHSMLYYDMDTSVISDKKFDKAARLLADKIQRFGPKKIASTQYGYVFKDFDGSTGFDLPDRLTEEDRKCVRRIATYVLRWYIASRKRGKS